MSARQRQVESQEVLRLWRAYSYAALRLAQYAPGGEALILPGGLLVTTGEVDPELNFAFVYGRDRVEAALRRFVDRLRERAVPAVVLAPSSVCSRVAPHAGELALEPVESRPLMLLDGPARPAPASIRGLEVRTVDDEAAFGEVRQVIARAFEMPPTVVERVYRSHILDLPGLRLFAAYLDGETASYLSSVTEGDVVWFFDVGTVPDHRHKGAASALLDGALRHFEERGRRVFGLTADAPAVPLYERLGFRVVDRGPVWLFRPE